MPPLPSETAVGALLRHWRTTRRLSQLELSLGAGVSSRHLSYVETGRSRPSRDMVVRLADVLDIPLRARNALLVAAGYAPRYVETGLAAKELLAEVLAYPGVPAEWRTREIGAPTTPLLTTIFRKDDVELRFFATITTFGTPHNVTLDELHIECSFPADDATAAACQALFVTRR